METDGGGGRRVAHVFPGEAATETTVQSFGQIRQGKHIVRGKCGRLYTRLLMVLVHYYLDIVFKM